MHADPDGERAFRLPERGKSLLAVFGFRFLLVTVLWLNLTLPFAPGWRVGDNPIFHVVTLLCFLGYALAYFRLRKTRRQDFLFILVNLVEFLVITVLVWFTGGLNSPFSILYLMLITGTLFQGSLRITLRVCMIAMAFYGGFLVLLFRGLLPVYYPFQGMERDSYPLDNGTYVATLLIWIAAYCVYTLALNIFLFRRLRAQTVTIDKQSDRLDNANRTLVASFHDMESISDRLHVTREAADSAKENLIRLEKVASLGRLAAGIVNELGNPLSSIIAETEILLMAEEFPSETKVKQTLKNNLASAARIKALMQSLKDSINPDEALRFEALDLNMIVLRAASLFRHEMEHRGIAMSTICDQADPRAHGVQSQIEQCVLNLLSNAHQSCPEEGGEVVVETRVGDGEVQMSVTDNGHGIRKEDMRRIFEPFFTTLTGSNHVGLGLYIVANIVDSHKGHILVESEPGKTTFTVVLPLVKN